jgi:hypothetical protein
VGDCVFAVVRGRHEIPFRDPRVRKALKSRGQVHKGAAHPSASGIQSKTPREPRMEILGWRGCLYEKHIRGPAVHDRGGAFSGRGRRAAGMGVRFSAGRYASGEPSRGSRRWRWSRTSSAGRRQLETPGWQQTGVHPGTD